MAEKELAIYEKLGLTKEKVIEMQNFLMEEFNAKEQTSVAEIIIKLSERYPQQLNMYGCFILGQVIIQARHMEEQGLPYWFNPNVA